jgi:ABC-type branched-subunit amino acid transport system permease subunit
VKTWVSWIAAAAVLVALPFVFNDPYPLHILVLVLIWAFLYTSWSMMGRFGLVSLGHGGFMGIGAHVTRCCGTISLSAPGSVFRSQCWRRPSPQC